MIKVYYQQRKSNKSLIDFFFLLFAMYSLTGESFLGVFGQFYILVYGNIHGNKEIKVN